MTSDFKWGTLIVTCLRRLRDSRECVVPFVDWEVLPPFYGSPDGIFAWFICDNAPTKDRFRADALSGTPPAACVSWPSRPGSRRSRQTRSRLM